MQIGQDKRLEHALRNEHPQGIAALDGFVLLGIADEQHAAILPVRDLKYLPQRFGAEQPSFINQHTFAAQARLKLGIQQQSGDRLGLGKPGFAQVRRGTGGRGKRLHAHALRFYCASCFLQERSFFPCALRLE